MSIVFNSAFSQLSPVGAGSAPAATSFSDTLQTADANAPIALMLDGSKWIFSQGQPNSTNAAAQWGEYQITTSSKDSANALVWKGKSAGSVQAITRLIPIVALASCYGKTQFCQLTLVTAASVSGTLAGGPAVLDNCGLCNGVSGTSTNQAAAYSCDINTDDHHHRLVRWNYANTSVLATGAANSTADGDVIRISGDLSVANQVTVTIKKNGSVLSQVTDTGANILVQGAQSILMDLTQAGGSHLDFRTFSCGTGL